MTQISSDIRQDCGDVMPRPSNPHSSESAEGAQRHVGHEGGVNATLHWVDETLAEYQRLVEEEFGSLETAAIQGARQYLRDRA